jgi:sortase A
MREQNRFSGFNTRRPVTPARQKVVGHNARPVQRRVPAGGMDGIVSKTPKFSFSEPSTNTRSAFPVTPSKTPHPKVQNGLKQSQYIKQIFDVPTTPRRRWQTPLIKAEEKKRRNHRISVWLKSQTKPQLAMISMAVLIFVFGLSASILGFKANSHVQAQAKKLSQQAPSEEDAGDRPDETHPGDNAVVNYRVDPDAPRRISIPKIGVNARIKPLGTKSNNELKAPANIYDAGWFDRSARLGERGGTATLIDGHVHGLTKPGVFYALKKVGLGEVIEVERGDGKIFKYEVVRTRTYNRHSVDMNAAMTAIDPALPGLNIMTCTGALEKDANTYSDRLLVQAVLID